MELDYQDPKRPRSHDSPDSQEQIRKHRIEQQHLAAQEKNRLRQVGQILDFVEASQPNQSSTQLVGQEANSSIENVPPMIPEVPIDLHGEWASLSWDNWCEGAIRNEEDLRLRLTFLEARFQKFVGTFETLSHQIGTMFNTINEVEARLISLGETHSLQIGSLETTLQERDQVIQENVRSRLDYGKLEMDLKAEQFLKSMHQSWSAEKKTEIKESVLATSCSHPEFQNGKVPLAEVQLLIERYMHDFQVESIKMREWVEEEKKKIADSYYKVGQKGPMDNPKYEGWFQQLFQEVRNLHVGGQHGKGDHSKLLQGIQLLATRIQKLEQGLGHMQDKHLPEIMQIFKKDVASIASQVKGIESTMRSSSFVSTVVPRLEAAALTWRTGVTAVVPLAAPLQSMQAMPPSISPIASKEKETTQLKGFFVNLPDPEEAGDPGVLKVIFFP